MFIIVSISIVFPHSRPRFNIHILEVKRFLWQGTVVPVDAYSHIMTTGRSELGHPTGEHKDLPECGMMTKFAFKVCTSTAPARGSAGGSPGSCPPSAGAQPPLSSETGTFFKHGLG